jgi:hypothetical protein
MYPSRQTTSQTLDLDIHERKLTQSDDMIGSIWTDARERVTARSVKRARDVDTIARRAPSRSPSYMFPVKVRSLPTHEGLERPLQDPGPIEIPFVIRHPVHPFTIIIYGPSGGTRNPFALDKPMSKIWPMSDGVERLPPKAAINTLETTSDRQTDQKLWKW